MNSHHEKFLSTICTCGKHKADARAKNNSHFDGCSEYDKNFQNYPAQNRVLGKAAPQELKVGGEFYGFTESRTQYIGKAIPPRFERKKNEYVPNLERLEGTTTQRQDFPGWPAQASQTKARDVYKGSSAKFDGTTTSKSDFQQYDLTPRYHHEGPKYVKNNAKFEGVSTKTADYGKKDLPPRFVGNHVIPYTQKADDRDFKSEVASSFTGAASERVLMKATREYVPSKAKFEGIPVTRADYGEKKLPARSNGNHHAAYAPKADDRDFKSEIASSFTGKSIQRVLVKPKREYVPSAAKFDGISASQDSYKLWDLPSLHRHEKDKYVPNMNSFEKHSSYASEYTAKTTERYSRPTPVYAPLNTAKFDGKSTNQTDFRFTGTGERAKDFAPKVIWQPVADDRDFISATRGAHTAKTIPTCPATEFA